MAPPPPESLQSLATSFDRVLCVEGKSERTRIIYGQSIEYLCRWLAAQGIGADLSALTRDHVLAWLQSLRRGGRSAGTVRTRWRGLVRFSRWLLAEGIVTTDPLAGITVEPSVPPPVPVFTDAELIALLDACRGRTFHDRRDEVVLRLLIDCGLRVSELTGLDLKHVDMDAGTLQVTGKGSRVRGAYFGSKTTLALDRYLRARRAHRHAEDPALLLGERGRLYPDGVRKMIKVRAERAGLDPATVHPHRFRHTAAHDWMLAGGQERDLMQLMGWRSEAMLARYGASAADHRAREAARRLRRGDRV